MIKNNIRVTKDQPGTREKSTFIILVRFFVRGSQEKRKGAARKGGDVAPNNSTRFAQDSKGYGRFDGENKSSRLSGANNLNERKFRPRIGKSLSDITV